MSWPYGTMGDADRVAQAAALDVETRPQFREFYREALRIDADARGTAGFGVLIPASGAPVFLELGLGPAAAQSALQEALGPDRVVRPLFKDTGDGENFRGFVGRYLVCQAEDRSAALNRAATSLHQYARGGAPARSGPRRGTSTVIHGDAVLLDVNGPGRAFVYTAGEEVYRIEDIRGCAAARKVFDFERYVVDNPDWWPHTEA